jgi:hypothetical protein
VIKPYLFYKKISKTLIMKKYLIASLALIALFSSCKKDKDNEKSGIFKGPEVQVHNGKASTWIQLDKKGDPLRLAISLTDAALNSVPVGNGDEGEHDHGNTENNWVLKFHPKASIIPFNHVGMGWNPIGHEPEPVYRKPHFDFHFYMMTAQEVAAIPAYEMAKDKFDNAPAAAYLPPAYFNAGGGVPQMGAHWVDPTSGEFNGQPFTQTFIYGSYDGKVNFYEPMITLEFLKNNTNYIRSIPQPARVQKTSWYPTKLRVVKHDGVTEIILDEFVYRLQS